MNESSFPPRGSAVSGCFCIEDDDFDGKSLGERQIHGPRDGWWGDTGLRNVEDALDCYGLDRPGE